MDDEEAGRYHYEISTELCRHTGSLLHLQRYGTERHRNLVTAHHGQVSQLQPSEASVHCCTCQWRRLSCRRGPLPVEEAPAAWQDVCAGRGQRRVGAVLKSEEGEGKGNHLTLAPNPPLPRHTCTFSLLFSFLPVFQPPLFPLSTSATLPLRNPNCTRKRRY